MTDFLEEAFNAGWRDFVRSVRQENAKSNRRLYKIIEAVRGKSFVDSLKNCVKATSKGGLPQLRITRRPKGIRLSDNRWSSILEIWIDQKSNNQLGMKGAAYVQVKENRFVKINFHNE